MVAEMGMDADRELDLVKKAQTGDRDAYGRLVDVYGDVVLAIAYSRVGNYTVSQDIAQDALVLGFEHLVSLRRPQSFGAWLKTITANLCNKWLKSRAYREKLHEDSVALREQLSYGNGASADERLEHKELHSMLDEMVANLPIRDREALVLYYFRGRSVREAADALGITSAAMKKRLERARNRLRDELTAHVEAELVETGRKRVMSGRVLAAIPFGASLAKVAPVATVLPSAPMLHLTGLLTKAGGVTMGIETKKVAGVAVALCVILMVVAGTTLVGRAKRPQEEPSPPPLELARVAPAEDVVAFLESAESVDVMAEEPSPVAVAAVTDEEEPDAEPQPASISGYVRDDAGYPFDGADIRLEIIGDNVGNDILEVYSTSTSADGTYEIGGIDTFGSAFVYASAEGYVMQKHRGLKLVPDSKRDDIDFTLPKGAYFVAGQVVSEHSDPIPGASVDLRYYGYNDESIKMTAETGATAGTVTSMANFVFATTGDEGHFEVAVPNKGLCDFTVKKKGYGPGFFPQVPTGTDDALFMLRAYGAISGKVTRANGSPAEGVEVEVTGEAFPAGLTPTRSAIQAFSILPRTAFTDQNGNYEANDLGEDYFYTVTVRDPAAGEVEGLGDTEARGSIEEVARGMVKEIYGYQPGALTKRGIRVTAGQITSGVDFVFGDKSGATVYGRVTDTTSGLPVYPVEISATPTTPDGPFATYGGGATSTDRDGYYMITLNPENTGTFRIRWRYINNGGGEPFRDDADVALLELGPGEEEELNFTIDAPITIPIRFINVDGGPLAGISAGIRRAGSGGGWGSRLTSGSDGRVTYHGMSPGRMYQAVGRAGDSVVGRSDPFTGQPGETVPEVEVVCHSTGGIEGIAVYADGELAAGETIGCVALLPDGPQTSGQVDNTDADGAFCILRALPEQQ